MTLSETLITLNQWQLAVAAAAFVVFIGVEQLWPFQKGRKDRLRRWGLNLGLFGGGFALVMLLGPWIQRLCEVLDRAIPFPPLVEMGMPAWLLVVVSFLLIDLLAYLMHMASHVVPGLWRLHRTHHSDIEVDASTGIRHHPLESLALGVVQLAVLAVLGVPVLVLIGYGLIAVIWQFFTHWDVALPEPIDKVLRVAVVTPGMHRIHHSVRMDEGNSNFSMVLSIWDRLFGTYRRCTADQRRAMVLGLESQREPVGLGRILADPLKS